MRTRSKVMAAFVIFALAFAGMLLLLRRDAGAPEAERVSVVRPRAPLRLAPPERTAGLSGTVRTKSGALTKSARVCATCASCDIAGIEDQVCTDTDQTGAYLLKDLGTAGYRVTAAAPGYALATADQGRLLFLELGARREHVDIVLDELGHDVEGHVLDATGGPIAAASVRLVSWGASPLMTTVTTDDEGRFTASVAAGPVTAIASAAGYASARAYRVAPTSDLTLALTPEAALSGTVLTVAEGRPVAGARVAALAQGGAPTGLGESVSSADGSFRIDGLDPSRYLVVATAPGYRGSETHTVELGMGQAVSDLQVLVAPVAQVSGRVVVESSGLQQPCEQGFVVLGPPHPAISLRAGSKWTAEKLGAQPQAPTTVMAPIGATGVVQFDAVPAGSYFASVECDGHLHHDGPDVVAVGDKDVHGLVWRVVPSVRLSIRVVDERDKPVPGANVDLRWPKSESQTGAVTGLEADEQGWTRPISHLFPGVYTASAAGGYEAEPVSIELKPGLREARATLRVKGSAALEVNVSDSGGRAVDTVRVLARPCQAAGATAPAAPTPAALAAGAAAPVQWMGVPQGQGHYRIAPLQAGCYRVEASDAVHPLLKAGGAEAELQIVSGQAVQLRVTLNREAKIQGRVLAADGAPLQDVWVSAVAAATSADRRQAAMQHSAGHAANRVLTDEDGRFVLSGLDHSNVYDLKAEQPDGASAVRRAVSTRESTVITLPKTGAIEGMVTDAHGKAVDDFTLHVVEAETQRMESRDFVHAAGRFSLLGVNPGKLQIHAIEPSGQVAQLSTELKSGQQLRGLRLSISD
ncbi:MAG TPA: carboxypeptidase-like regulatory domain-containing protein [Polyangiales bacterium]